MADIVLTGNTSGAITVAAPAVAGTHTLTLPTETGTLATTTDVSNSIGRNLIINGDMRIAQRATSVSSITSGGYKTCDRWQTNIGTGGTWTQSQDTGVTNEGFANSLKYDCTTANASLSSGSNLNLCHRFEGQNLQHLKKGTANAESVTISFWVKSNKTGDYVFELWDRDNDRHIADTYTVSSANTWEKKTITFAGDTSGAFGNDANKSLEANWWLVAGTDYTTGTAPTSWAGRTNANRAVGQTVNLADSTANYINITGVQLEAGTTATPFEHRPYDMELARCMRYYEQYSGANTHGGLYNTGSYIGHVQYKVRKRTRPTLTATGNGFTSVSNSSSGDEGGTDNMFFNGTSGGMYIITLTIDAEL